MSRKASTTLIGTFALLGMAIGFFALFLLGGGGLFDQRTRVVLFFDKSINGLSVGSDARFGGVLIGRVVEIDVLIDVENNRKVIPVTVEISRRQVAHIAQEAGAFDFGSPEGVRQAVDFGLRARLTQQSLVTGVLYVEFDIDPKSPGLVFDDRFAKGLPVIPTLAMEFDEMIAAIGEGLETLNSLDLEELITDIRTLATTTSNQIADLQLAEISKEMLAVTANLREITGQEGWRDAAGNLNAAITDLRAAMGAVEASVLPATEDLRNAMQAAEQGMERFQDVAGNLADFTNPRSPAMLRVQNTMVELERAARAIRELAEEIQRQPGALIKGREMPE